MGVVDGDINYFTCTLGQAARWKADHPTSPSFQTVVEMIDGQAREYPNSPALGFANFRSQKSDPLTFSRLSSLSHVAAHALAACLGSTPPGSVGLLCTSGFDFVLTWLGLVSLGHSVLLLAPQLEPAAIQYLCTTTGATVIFSDDAHRSRLSTLEGFQILGIPDYSSEQVKEIERRTISDVAYFVHTSGTSSGLPKPIPQTHRGVIEVVPRLPGPHPATFTTTPMYHGGLVDCFRAWASGAAVWFFPEGVVPITGANVLSAVNFARDQSTVPVQYFTSVPYILQMLAESSEGVELLKTMDLVGVGGAALPPAVGDKLVNADVNLVSRMGSAECGFLMSSHRNYAADKEWQYLRPVTDTSLLVFEPRDDGLAELVAQAGWPCLAKTNRGGAYTTADLFEPHATIPNAWRYHSRADAQIMLANGKKFDPSPVEGAVLAAVPVLRDVLIFGSGREYAGALLFPTEGATGDLVEIAWPTFKALNDGTQSHARIAKTMLVPLHGPPLEKSSKGTILRRQAEERYRDAIEGAYQGKKTVSLPPDAPDEMVSAAVLGCFSQVLGRDVDPAADLYQQGVDSIASIQIRKGVEALLPGEGHLPINVLYDLGTVQALVAHLQRLRHGTQVEGSRDSMGLMRDLVTKYSDFNFDGVRPRDKVGAVVVLTGATGFLGAYILHLLRQDPQVRRVYCLLRAQTLFAAHERVTKALSKRGMPGLEPFQESVQSKVICLPCRLSDDDLGLSDEQRQQITSEATLVIHSAWTVNFTLRLSSFENQIAATRNLINLAVHAGARFAFVSSIAAVASSPSVPIRESVSDDPVESSPLGYSQSKWVAEQVCAAANKALAGAYSSFAILRVGQLCGNQAGIWNASEAYPLMLSTAKLTGCLPDLQGEGLNWLPVDIAAQAVLDIAWPGETGGVTKTPVYHVLNPHITPTWTQMLHWILEEGESFTIVEPSAWIAKLEGVMEGEGSHPSHALLGLWKDSLAKDEPVVKRTGVSAPKFDVQLAKQASETMRHVQPLDRGTVIKLWRWINEEIGSE